MVLFVWIMYIIELYEFVIIIELLIVWVGVVLIIMYLYWVLSWVISLLKFLLVSNFCGFDGIVFVDNIFILDFLFCIKYLLKVCDFKIKFVILGW